MQINPVHNNQPHVNPLALPFQNLSQKNELANNGVNTEDNEAFRSMINASQEKKESVKFDGSAEAKMAANQRMATAASIKTGSFGSMIDPEKLDEELKLLTQLLIEDYRDADPSQEKDHSDSMMKFLNFMIAGNGAQLSKLVYENNNLIKNQNRVSMENRIGKKVQYQDSFFEVQQADTSVPIYYRLGRDATEGKIKILDEEGKTVQEIDLKKTEKGDHKIEWDRSLKDVDPTEQLAEPGVYYIQFTAVDKDKNPVEHIVELEGIVSQVDSNEKGIDYYISGIKVDGRITKVSMPNQQDMGASIAKHLKDIKGDLTIGNPITPDQILINNDTNIIDVNI